MKILFVSWDGPQVTYLEGLFLPIFTALEAHGITFHVLQFTWADARAVRLTRLAYEAKGIPYQSVRVWRHPKAIGALLTAWRGARHVRRVVQSQGIDVIMPRSIMPALATLMARGIRDTPMVFDADGLSIDERVDFLGESPTSLRYRVTRDIETEAVRRAIVVLTRTARAAEILQARAGAGTAIDKFHVVGNGRDPQQFHAFGPHDRRRVRARLGIPDDAPLLVYAGSLGDQYCPMDMLRLFAQVLRRRPDARLLVISRSGDAMLKLAVQMSLPVDAMTVVALEPEEVAEHLACADLGLALRTPSFSMQGVAPIKLGEYLLCGLPVVASTVIANADVVDGRTGVLLEVIDRPSLDAAADWLVDAVLPDREGFRRRCVHLGRARFSLDSSVAAYLGAVAPLRDGPEVRVDGLRPASALDPRVVG